MGYALIHDGREILLRGKAALIGRHPTCKVMLDHESVSRKHARLVMTGEQAQIVDLDSPNGVFVNGARIVKHHDLTSGDIVAIGEQELYFIASDDIDPKSSRPPPDDDGFTGKNVLTAVNDATALICTMARRLLEAGEVQAAEATLKDRWKQLMSRSHAAHPALTIFAARTGFKMAAATKRGAWADDAAVMLAAADKAPNSDTLRDIEIAIAATGTSKAIMTYLKTINAESLDAQARAMRAAILGEK